MGPSDLAAQRRLLTTDRDGTTARIDALTRNVSTIVEAAQLTSTDDEHDPEGATIAFEREQASALLASATRHLAEIDAALERIEAGTYGVCVRCGEPIAPERLRARPAASTCIRCAS